MKLSSNVWNEETPNGTGQAKIACDDTRMIRAGLSKPADHANLIAYLKSYLK